MQHSRRGGKLGHHRSRSRHGGAAARSQRDGHSAGHAALLWHRRAHPLLDKHHCQVRSGFGGWGGWGLGVGGMLLSPEAETYSCSTRQALRGCLQQGWMRGPAAVSSPPPQPSPAAATTQCVQLLSPLNAGTPATTAPHHMANWCVSTLGGAERRCCRRPSSHTWVSCLQRIAVLCCAGILCWGCVVAPGSRSVLRPLAAPKHACLCLRCKVHTRSAGKPVSSVHMGMACRRCGCCFRTKLVPARLLT